MVPPTNQIICGDALETLKKLPSKYIQCVITSPPYLWLRDYGIPGQIGLEETPEEYIQKLVAVFREVRRVLRDDGTLWFNIGEKRANDDKWGGSTGGKHVKELHGESTMRRKRQSGLPPKNLLMIPARVALALQTDGWILRQDNIWYKPTAMVESVLDRPSDAHEHIFLFTKKPKYFYDADSIREPLKPKTLTTYGTQHHAQGNDALGLVKSDNWGRTVKERKPRLTSDGEIAGANKRNVWTIKSQSFSGAHHATFPPKLVEICLLAGTSPHACEHCRSPWKRVVLKSRGNKQQKREAAHAVDNMPTKSDSTGWEPTRLVTNRWEPSCRCEENQGTGRCIVLDPFCGSGTVPFVAIQYGRDYLGIDLKPDYIELEKQRLAVVPVRLWSE